jgi:hypothetical protein
MKALTKLLDKLDEGSTWVGIVTFLVSAFNLDVAQPLIEQGSQAAAALAGLGLMILREDKSGK